MSPPAELVFKTLTQELPQPAPQREVPLKKHLEAAFSLTCVPQTGCPASGEHWLFFSPKKLIYPGTGLGWGFREMAAPSLCSAVKGQTVMLSWPHTTSIISKLLFDESRKGQAQGSEGCVRGT